MTILNGKKRIQNEFCRDGWGRTPIDRRKCIGLYWRIQQESERIDNASVSILHEDDNDDVVSFNIGTDKKDYKFNESNAFDGWKGES